MIKRRSTGRFLLCCTLLLSMLIFVACGGSTADAPSEESAAASSSEAENTDADSSDASSESTDESAAEEAASTENRTEENASQETEMAGITTASGLQFIEEVAGTGRAAEVGDKVAVHYTGTLEDGTKFDSSLDRGTPFDFVLGKGMVIQGWDEGIDLMAEGGKARLIIPAELGYGDRGAGGGAIPPGATLIFDVELVSVSDGPPGAPAAPQEVAEEDFTTTDSGLKYYDITEGDGAVAEAGQNAVVHYTGWLTDGTKFDSSLDRGDPFSFPIGGGRVIQGWDEGVAGMKIGGQRQLIIPAELGYGTSGAGGVIPPNATLIFEVELVDLQ